jgi:hypothetical protein
MKRKVTMLPMMKRKVMRIAMMTEWGTYHAHIRSDEEESDDDIDDDRQYR